MATVFLLSALVALPVMGQNDQSGRPPVSWVEIADALRVMPPPDKEGRRRTYSPSDNAQKELRSRIENLKKRGDIILPIVERLKQPPTDEAAEAEAYNLVMVLKENPDERALSVLEEIAKRKPLTTYFMREQGTRARYPSAWEAKQIIDTIRVAKARSGWERELDGTSKARRRELLAATYWSSTEVEEYRRRGAGWLLNTEFSPSERVTELVSRLPGVLRADSPWKKKILTHMTEELRRLAKGGADRSQVLGILEQISRDSVDAESRGYAKAVMQTIE